MPLLAMDGARSSSSTPRWRALGSCGVEHRDCGEPRLGAELLQHEGPIEERLDVDATAGRSDVAGQRRLTMDCVSASAIFRTAAPSVDTTAWTCPPEVPIWTMCLTFVSA